MANRIVAGKAFIVLEAVNKTGKVLDSTYRQFMRFGTQIQSIGQRIISRALVAATPQAISTKVFTDFDDIMKKVEARSVGTSQEMQNLRNQARELGRTTSFTARQVGSLMDVLVQRGFTRPEIFTMTPEILNLARAGGSGNLDQDVLDAADLVSGALNGYQLDAKESARITDLFTQAVNDSNFDLQDLIVSMANVASIAKLYNMRIEETLGLLAVMRNVNIDPSVAGTGLRNILLKASDEKGSEEFNELLSKATGNIIRFRDEAQNLKPAADIIFSMFDAMKGLGTAEQGDLLSELFGLRAIIPAGATLPQRAEFERFVNELYKVGGVAKRQAADMDSGLGGAFRRIRGGVESLAISMGQSLELTLQSTSMKFRTLIADLDAWIQQNQRTVVSVAILTAASLALGITLIAVGAIIKILSVGFLILSVAITAISTTFLILKFLVVTVWAVLAAFATFCFTVIPAIIGAIITASALIIPFIAGIFTAMIAWIAGLIMSIPFLIGALLQVARVAVIAFLRWIAKYIGVGLTKSLFRLTVLLGFGKAKYDMGGPIHEGNMLTYGEEKKPEPIAIVEVAPETEGILSRIWGMATRAATGITSLLIGVTTTIGTALSNIFTLASSITQSIVDAITSGHIEHAWAMMSLSMRIVFLELKNAVLAMIMQIRNGIVDMIIPVLRSLSHSLATLYHGLGLKGYGPMDHLSFVKSLPRTSDNQWEKNKQEKEQSDRNKEIGLANLQLKAAEWMYKLFPGMNIVDKNKGMVDRVLTSLGVPRLTENLAMAGVPSPTAKGADMPDAVEKGTAAAMKQFWKNREQNRDVLSQLAQANAHLININNGIAGLNNPQGH